MPQLAQQPLSFLGPGKQIASSDRIAPLLPLPTPGIMQELPCGHFMHSHCFAAYTRYSYTCPICFKSLGDMSVYWQVGRAAVLG